MHIFTEFTDLLKSFAAVLMTNNRVIVSAPPGAGKTTIIPPMLLDQPWCGSARILVLEPRRVAVRAAAGFMARQRFERLGATIGYRVRLESKVSATTRIEVVTSGIFLRQIAADPGLDGVAAVIFDEFHERSLDADLSLALCLESQSALRPDLKIIVMSATLDIDKLTNILDDPPILSLKDRRHPIDTYYLGRDKQARIEENMAKAILRALAEEQGSVLAFLPGQAEIRRTLERLKEKIDDPCVILTSLHGGLNSNEQDLAIAPVGEGKRKVVLATAIAQTSLTIEGVRIVIDCGLNRLPEFDPATGLSRLVTERVSLATAEQRRGRAGRLGPGICYRLWDEPENRALAPHERPEILGADLTSLALALADWGVDDPKQLQWIDAPPETRFMQARALLADLDALDENGRITPMGRKLATLPLHPRLAHMIEQAAVYNAAYDAALIAAFLSDTQINRGDSDAERRFEHFLNDPGKAARAVKDQARNWVRDNLETPRQSMVSFAGLLSLGYPDRIAMARPGRPGHFLLANGRGAYLDERDVLARKKFLCIAELSGALESARILLAAEMPYDDLMRFHGHHIKESVHVKFDPQSGSVKATKQNRLHALILKESPATPEPLAAIEAIMAGIRQVGLHVLPWPRYIRSWRARLAFLHASNPTRWPDLSDEKLLSELEIWLGPVLTGCTKLSAIDPDILSNALQALLPWPLQREMEKDAPTHFKAPTGFSHPIDYEAEGGPATSLRLQEMFGVREHPMAAGQPLTLILLSPAHRPIQITRDLPGFWVGSYAAVRAEMRGRYPRHPWPDDPLSEPPTRRVKAKPDKGL